MSYDPSGAHLTVTNKIITSGGAVLLYGLVPWLVFKTVRKIKKQWLNRNNKEKSASELV